MTKRANVQRNVACLWEWLFFACSGWLIERIQCGLTVASTQQYERLDDAQPVDAVPEVIPFERLQRAREVRQRLPDRKGRDDARRGETSQGPPRGYRRARWLPALRPPV